MSVTTDSSAEVVEGFAGTTPETNNVTTASFTSQLRPYPDLIVTALGVSPTAVQTGQSVVVSWHTDNTGTSAVTQAFTDRVKIFNPANGKVLVNQALAYDPASAGTIAPGGSRSRSLTVVVPDGSDSVGNLVVSVTTDDLNTVFEYNASSTGQTTTTTTTALTATLAPYPDLIASNVTAPTGEIIADPAPITVGWKVTNAGTRDAQAAGWPSFRRRTRSTSAVRTTTCSRVVACPVDSVGWAAPLTAGVTAPRYLPWPTTPASVASTLNGTATAYGAKETSLAAPATAAMTGCS